MNDFEILSELIHEKSKISILKDRYDKFEVKLEEPDCKDSSIIIRHIPEDAFVIKIDNFPDPSNIFKGSRGECRRADFGLIVPSKKCILLIEMKRNKKEQSSIVKQLLGAQCCIEYYKIIGEKFFPCDSFLKNYVFRFISIGHTGIAKRRPRVEKTKIQASIPKKGKKSNKNNQKHNSPENMLKVDWAPSVHFNQLASLS